MQKRDLHNNLLFTNVVPPVSTAADTPVVSAVVDTRGHLATEFVILLGGLTDPDATFAVTVQHGDAVDNEAAPTAITDSAAADPACLLGTLAEAGFTFAADNGLRKIGYNPNKGAGKRWVRLTITPTGNAAAALLAVLCVRRPMNVPVV